MLAKTRRNGFPHARHLILVRLREWFILPIAYLGILTFPLWWLLALPNDIRCRLAIRGATRDPCVSLAGVVRLREFVCRVYAFAGDEDTYYELRYADGSRRVVFDADGAIYRRLEARGQRPGQTLRFTNTDVMMWCWWPLVAGPTAVVVLIVLRACC